MNQYVGNFTLCFMQINRFRCSHSCMILQTRIDLDYVSPDLTSSDCSTSTVDVSKKRYPQQSYQLLHVQASDVTQQNAFHTSAEFLAEYQKCHVSVYYDVFQSDWNGYYRMVIDTINELSLSAHFEVHLRSQIFKTLIHFKQKQNIVRIEKIQLRLY